MLIIDNDSYNDNRSTSTSLYVIEADLNKSDFFYKDDFVPLNRINNKYYQVEIEAPSDVIIHGLLDAKEYDSYVVKINIDNNYTPVILTTEFFNRYEPSVSFGYYIEEKDIVILCSYIMIERSVNFTFLHKEMHKFTDLNFLHRYLYMSFKNLPGRFKYVNELVKNSKYASDEFKEYVNKMEILE